MHQQSKSSESKVKFRQASNRCKRIFEADKIAYANKTKESINSNKLGPRNIWRINNCVLNKAKPAIPHLLSGMDVLFSAPDKQKLFAENFSRNSNLDDFLSLYLFSLLKTNLKLHNFSCDPQVD